MNTSGTLRDAGGGRRRREMKVGLLLCLEGWVTNENRSKGKSGDFVRQRRSRRRKSHVDTFANDTNHGRRLKSEED